MLSKKLTERIIICKLKSTYKHIIRRSENMNDYSLTKEESKTQFVKNYIVKDDHTIEIEFGNGRLYTIKYSENAIRNLNKLMKTEVEEAKKSSLVIRSLTGFVGVAFGAIFASAGLFTTLEPNITFPALTITVGITGGVVSLYSLTKGVGYALKAKDLSKNKDFLTIEDQLNATINENKNILSGVEQKIPEEAKQQDGSYHFNLHVADYMSHRTIKKIKTNLDCSDFVDKNIDPQPKQKELIKK